MGQSPSTASMDIKLASSRRPARAVGYLAQGRRADGNGGGTAGTSLAGVVAASVTNNHTSESPHPVPPRRRGTGSNRNPPPPASRLGQTSTPKRAGGRHLDGVEAEPQSPCTEAPVESPDENPDDAPLKLTNKPIRIAMWNMCRQGTRKDPSGRKKIRFVEQVMTLENIDVLVLTETHTTSVPVSHRVRVLEQTGLAA